VQRIGNQGEASGEDATHDLDHRKTDIDDDGGDQLPVAHPVVVVAVMIGVVRVIVRHVPSRLARPGLLRRILRHLCRRKQGGCRPGPGAGRGWRQAESQGSRSRLPCCGRVTS